MSTNFISQVQALNKIGQVSTGAYSNLYATKQFLINNGGFNTSLLTGYPNNYDFVVDDDIAAKPVATRKITITPIVHYTNANGPFSTNVNKYYMACSVVLSPNVPGETFNDSRQARLAWESSYQSIGFKPYADAGSPESSIGTDSTLTPVTTTGLNQSYINYTYGEVRSAIFYFGMSNSPFTASSTANDFKINGSSVMSISELGRFPIEFGISGWWGTSTDILSQLSGINDSTSSDWSGSIDIYITFNH